MKKILVVMAVVLLVSPWAQGAEGQRPTLRRRVAVSSGAQSTECAKIKQLAAKTAEWEGKVMTVTGLISPDQLGITMPHEHILIRVLGPKTDLMDEGVATEELSLFPKAGGKTIVDVTSIGLSRDPAALKRISEKSGAQVVMGCGYYKDGWQHMGIRAMTEDDIVEEMVRDIVIGVGGVHAGIIGELGVDYPPKDQPFYPFEEKNLKAGARAQKLTGAAINVHMECNATPHELNSGIDILEKAGADLSRVVISHRLPRPWELHILEHIADRGCYIEFDTFGLEIWPSLRNQLNGKEDAPATIKALIKDGYINKILLSMDFDCQLCYKRNGGYGYAHIINEVVPELKAAGVTDEQIHTMIVENPKRLLPFKNYAK